MLAPVLLPVPGSAPQLPFINVVGEPVARSLVKARETGAQIADHVVHVPAVLSDLVGQGDQRGQGLLQHLAAPGDEKGDAVVAKHALQAAAVVLKAPHRHGDVPPAAALLPYQGEDVGRGSLALGGDALGIAQADAARVQLAPFPAVAEELVAKEPQGRRPAAAFLLLLHPDLHAQLFRQGGELAEGAAAESVDLILAVGIVQGEADGELRAPSQHGPQHRLLLGGEVQKAVHIDPGLRADGALLDLLCQQGQPVGGVRMTVGHHRVVGLLDKGQILQLLLQSLAAALRRGLQLLGCDASGLQLLQSGEQEALGLRPAAGPVVDLQPGAHGIQGQSHAQKLPALVQHGSSQAPVKLGHAPGKTCEAEHLRREGETVSADAAELPLRFVAVLLRH